MAKNLSQTIKNFYLTLGWIPFYKPFLSYGSEKEIRILGETVLHKKQGKKIRKGLFSFLNPRIGSVELEGSVKINGDKKTFLIKSDDAGLVDCNLDIKLPEGEYEVEYKITNSFFPLAVSEENIHKGKLRILKNENRIAVVSDWDDTVLTSNMSSNTKSIFLAMLSNPKNRKLIPGMNRFFNELIKKYQNPPVFYLSTTTWKFYDYIYFLIKKNKLPLTSLLLSEWNLNKDFATYHKNYKKNNIEQLIKMFPKFNWLLIGDDSERDPEIYESIKKIHPKKIENIVIRKTNQKDNKNKTSNQRNSDGYGLLNFLV